MTDLLIEEEWCILVRVYFQMVFVELVFRALFFSFDHGMVYIHKIAKGVFGTYIKTWVRRVGERCGFRR